MHEKGELESWKKGGGQWEQEGMGIQGRRPDSEARTCTLTAFLGSNYQANPHFAINVAFKAGTFESCWLHGHWSTVSAHLCINM